MIQRIFVSGVLSLTSFLAFEMAVTVIVSATGSSAAFAADAPMEKKAAPTSRPARTPSTRPAPASQDGEPVGTFTADQVEQLIPLEGKIVVVTGVVKKIVKPADRVLLLDFSEQGKKGFTCVAFSDKDPAVHKELSGETGAAFVGKPVQVKGIVVIYKGLPEIHVQAMTQITASPAEAAPAKQ